MVDADDHYLLLYDYVDGMLERRAPYREAHLARVASEREQGRIVMAGALGDPPSGAAFVFKGVERKTVEEFVEGDPYVEAGLVTGCRVEPWRLV
jgi:uncharacterized protein YciI